MMTTPYAAFLSDPSLLFWRRRGDVTARNRRFLYLVMFWLGALLGAVVAKWSTTLVMTLITIGCKLLALDLVGLAKGEELEEPSPAKVNVRRRSSAIVYRNWEGERVRDEVACRDVAADGHQDRLENSGLSLRCRRRVSSH